MWIWDSRTHQFITSNALSKCNSAFSKMIQIHQDLFILGIEAPDRIFKDFTNHYFNCTANIYGIHKGKIITKITEEIDLINQMISKTHKTIHRKGLAPFLVSMLNSPLKSLIFELGVISHYIADLHQPLHTDGKDRFADEETIHKIMESDTRKHLDDFSLSFSKKRTRIYSPQNYFEKQIYSINKSYDAIIENYYLKKGKVKPDRWQKSVPLVEYCLSKAAQNVANVFLSFESAPHRFQAHIKKEKLQTKIIKEIKLNSKYKLIKYPSGTISLRKKSKKR